MPTKKPLSFEGVHRFLKTLFAEDLHAKRVLSLAGATLGVIESASLAVAMIGQGLALARGRLTKHTIKQVDRLLSNPGIDVDALLVHWVPYVVGSRSSITVAMDWTDFDADGQTTIMLSLLCRHGRATPLVWLTVDTATLKDRRNAYEYQVLVRLAEVLPTEVRVRIVADRGFGDQKLYRVLTEELKFDFVIRFRGNIKVTAADGEARAAAEWVGVGGRARVLRGATVTTVTATGFPVDTVVCVQSYPQSAEKGRQADNSRTQLAARQMLTPTAAVTGCHGRPLGIAAQSVFSVVQAKMRKEPCAFAGLTDTHRIDLAVLDNL